MRVRVGRGAEKAGGGGAFGRRCLGRAGRMRFGAAGRCACALGEAKGGGGGGACLEAAAAPRLRFSPGFAAGPGRAGARGGPFAAARGRPAASARRLLLPGLLG